MAAAPPHPLLRQEDSPGGVLRFFPAHPHEGDVDAPPGDKSARVIATGHSKATDRPFNLVVAFETVQGDHGTKLGRAVAQSTFHHFCDYNWDIRSGCPSFVDEPPGDGIRQPPEARRSIETYAQPGRVACRRHAVTRRIVAWLPSAVNGKFRSSRWNGRRPVLQLSPQVRRVLQSPASRRGFSLRAAGLLI